MPLDIPILFDYVEEASAETSRTYFIDWEGGRISGYVDGLEAVNQYIKKVLLTPRFQCLIYDGQYGSEVRNILADAAVTREYVMAAMQFFVEDALLYDERILRVYNLDVTLGDSYPMRDSVVVTFEVDTVFGEVYVEEVV